MPRLSRTTDKTKRSRSARGAEETARLEPPAIAASKNPIRLAVAVRPALYRELLSRLLRVERGITVVGEAADEDEIGRLLARERPAILIFDYEGLGPSAEGTLNRLRRSAPTTRILVLASRSSDETVQRVLRAGASGLLGKHLEFSMLLRALRAVAAGEVWANRHATSEALEGLTGAARASKNGLTVREQQIAEACGRGLRNKEIASRLNISSKTVKSHLNNIFRKLQVDNRLALALNISQKA